MPEGSGRTTEERLAEVERRLAELEARLGAGPSAGPATPPVVARPPAPSARLAPWSSRLPSISAALVLGWGGAAALVLAAAYLVRLSIVTGWLTPGRQVAAAALAGAGLVAGGLALRLRDRAYASLLAAAGIAVLYLAVYGAHLYHDLIGAPTATGLVVAVAALSLGLHALHRAPLFVAFALAGSYSAPLLIPGRGTLSDLAIYLTVWNVVYAIYALWLGRRAVYLAALYASIVVFDAAWRWGDATGAWQTAALFQLGQFLLFGAAVAWFSVRHGALAGWGVAAAHYGALFLLYVVEYAILHEHAPALAPWAAAAFAAALYAAWLAARAATGAGHATSLRVVHAFSALVLVHAVWLETVDGAWKPLVALALAVGLRVLPRLAPVLRPRWEPWRAAAFLLFAMGYFELVIDWRAAGSVADEALALLWPAVLYSLYLRRPLDEPSEQGARVLLLFFAHALALGACALLVERWVGDPGTTVERLWLSLGWAAIGVGWLVAALVRGDRMLARSTLGIFALFAGKVVLLDLDQADALVRVGILAVLGAALYAGGWIYRRIIEPGIAGGET